MWIIGVIMMQIHIFCLNLSMSVLMKRTFILLLRRFCLIKWWATQHGRLACQLVETWEHLIGCKEECLTRTFSVTALLAAHKFVTRVGVSHRFSPSLVVLLGPGWAERDRRLSSVTFWQGLNVGWLHTDGSRQEGEPVTRQHVWEPELFQRQNLRICNRIRTQFSYLTLTLQQGRSQIQLLMRGSGSGYGDTDLIWPRWLQRQRRLVMQPVSHVF